MKTQWFDHTRGRAALVSRAAPAAVRRGQSPARLASLVLVLAAAQGCRCSQHNPGAAAPAASQVAAPKPPARALTGTHQAIWGSGPHDVWAVGPHGALAHYDGKTWQTQPSGTTKNLLSVTGSAADDVWVVGQDGVTLHYDGKAWKQTEHDVENRMLLAVSATSRSDVWAAGVDDNVGIMRHYRDGKAWESLNIGPASSLWRIWVGPQEVWMVGANDKNRGFVMRGDGKQFAAVPFEGGPLRAIYGTGKKDVWVASYDGAVHHWDGTKWTQVMSQPNAHWLNFFGFGAHDIWVVGFDGRVMHYDGTKWSRVESGTHDMLWAAWGSAANDLWVVGSNGALLHWDGKTFTER